jgi:hypothetical protein
MAHGQHETILVSLNPEVLYENVQASASRRGKDDVFPETQIQMRLRPHGKGQTYPLQAGKDKIAVLIFYGETF